MKRATDRNAESLEISTLLFNYSEKLNLRKSWDCITSSLCTWDIKQTSSSSAVFWPLTAFFQRCHSVMPFWFFLSLQGKIRRIVRGCVKSQRKKGKSRTPFPFVQKFSFLKPYKPWKIGQMASYKLSISLCAKTCIFETLKSLKLQGNRNLYLVNNH